jgi:hypothetical protein
MLSGIAPTPARRMLLAHKPRCDLALAGTRLVRRAMMRRTVVRRPMLPMRRAMWRAHDDDRRTNDMGALQIAGADPALHTAPVDVAPASLASRNIHTSTTRQRRDLVVSRSWPGANVEAGGCMGAIRQSRGRRPKNRGQYGRNTKQQSKSHQSLHSMTAGDTPTSVALSFPTQGSKATRQHRADRMLRPNLPRQGSGAWKESQ